MPDFPRVYWVNQYAVAPDQPGGTRHYDMAAEFIRRGVDVTIVASDLSLATRTYGRRRRAWDLRPIHEDVKGVPYVWLPAGSYSGNDWRRALGMVVFGVAVTTYLVTRRRLRDAVLIGSSPHLFAAFGTWLASALRGNRFVLEVRDLWPESYVAVSGGGSGMMVLVLRVLADHLYRRAAAVVVLAEPNRDHIEKRGVDPARIHYVPNGVDLVALEIVRKPRRPEAPVVFVYAGAHGPANGLDVVVDASEQLDRAGITDIQVVLVGDGPAKAELMERARSAGLTSLEFRGPVPKNEMAQVLASADVGLMVLADVELFRTGVSPNKLFDYLAADLAVLTNVPGVVANVVNDAGAGRVVPPGDPTALAEAMVELSAEILADPACYRSGRAYVAEHHDRRVLADRMLTLVLAGEP